jgi:hypothetical protein
MRKTLLLGVLMLAVACGTYRFPGQPPGGTGTVSGQVVAVGCGMGGPVAKMCAQPMVPVCPPDGVASGDCAAPGSQAIVCPAPGPATPRTGCGPVPIPGLELDFTNGSSAERTQTDSNGHFAIDLAVGTWTVGTTGYWQIVSGPKTISVAAGDGIVANYTVWSKIAYLSMTPGGTDVSASASR